MELRDSAGYDGPLDIGPGPSGKDWLDEFRKDLSSIIHALLTWKECAIDTMYQALDFNAGNDGSFSYDGPFSVPKEFRTITDIVALWCDSELHIDPSALTEVRRRFEAFEGKKTGTPWKPVKVCFSMDDQEIEEMMHKAMDVFDRAYHKSLARFNTKEREAINKQPPAAWKPRGKTMQIIEAMKQGMDADAITEKFGITNKYAWTLRSRAKENGMLKS